MKEHEVELSDTVVETITNESGRLKKSVVNCVLQALGQKASHEEKYGDHIFSAYPDPDDVEEGEMTMEVHVSIAEPDVDEEHASIVTSINKNLVTKVAKALETCSEQSKKGARRKKHKTKKSKKVKKMTRRR